MTQIARQAAKLLGATITEVTSLHGGDLSDVFRIETADGESFVVKSGPRSQAEAEMLLAIARAGAPAPDVVAATDETLILEDLGEDHGPGGAWADLGAVLRRLHATTAAEPGWICDHAFGPVSIPNAPAADWPGFWADRRLLPSSTHCPADVARRIERLAARLPEILPAHPRLSLLHGDLWTGNIMARHGRVTGLIDPACYFGHAEVDLAMLGLFGSPSPDFWSAYGTLEPGFEDRQPVYRLWPALVHLHLFGGGYLGLVERCLDQAEGA